MQPLVPLIPAWQFHALAIVGGIGAGVLGGYALGLLPRAGQALRAQWRAAGPRRAWQLALSGRGQ